MKRSLTSLLFIALAGGFLAFGSVYAAFTASDSDDGEISAATLSITVLGTDTNTLDFELVASPGTDCDAVFPGDACQDAVNVTNNSDVPVTLAVPVAVESGELEDCGDGNSLVTTFVLGYVPNSQLIGIGGVATFDIITTFVESATQAATDECQGKTGTVTVTVTASS